MQLSQLEQTIFQQNKEALSSDSSVELLVMLNRSTHIVTLPLSSSFSFIPSIVKKIEN